jgi:hypothetical protein
VYLLFVQFESSKSENFHREPLFHQGFTIATKTTNMLVLSCYLGMAGIIRLTTVIAGLPVYHGLSDEKRSLIFHMMLHLDASKCINDEILPQIFDEFTGMNRALDRGGPLSSTRTAKFNAMVKSLLIIV